MKEVTLKDRLRLEGVTVSVEGLVVYECTFCLDRIWPVETRNELDARIAAQQAIVTNRRLNPILSRLP